MARREMTVERYREIKRLLGLGVPLRKIARSVKCTRRTIRQIRDGTQVDPGKPRVLEGPLWSLGIDWDSVLEEVIGGHPLKFIRYHTMPLSEAVLNNNIIPIAGGIAERGSMVPNGFQMFQIFKLYDHVCT